jgi:TPR repeat protein
MNAQDSLGLLYEDGSGVVKNLAKAVELYREAAGRGNEWAQLNLARLYESGTGVVKDLAKQKNFIRRQLTRETRPQEDTWIGCASSAGNGMGGGGCE